MEDQQFLVIRDTTSLDVLDENLYSYENVLYTLMPSMQDAASERLFTKVKRFVDSVPAMKQAQELVQDKIEYIPRLDLIPDEIKQAVKSGLAELIPVKDVNNAFFLQIRTKVGGLIINGKEYGKNRKIGDIALGTKNIPADVVGAMQCLSMQNQLNQVTKGLKEISEACEFNFGRLIQGQRDDRLAKLLSSRSCFIQALTLSDESLQRQMLIQAVHDANSARAELAFQIRSDIALLGDEKKPNSKTMGKIVNDINKTIIAMDNAVQLTLYSYQALGEHSAQLSVVKEHETFIKQVLLKEIDYQDSKQIAWRVICSHGNSRTTPQDFESLPNKLLISCDAFIGNKNKDLIKITEGETND